MTQIGSSEAKANFSELLERAAKGEEIVITEHGRPVARLVPAINDDRTEALAAFEALKVLRASSTLGDISWQELRDLGRR